MRAAKPTVAAGCRMIFWTRVKGPSRTGYPVWRSLPVSRHRSATYSPRQLWRQACRRARYALERQCDGETPDKARVSDIPSVLMPERFARFVMVINLAFRHVIGCSTQSRPMTDASCRHSDQGGQFASMDRMFAGALRPLALAGLLLGTQTLEHSMRAFGNCHDNADVQPAPARRDRRKTCWTRKATRQGVVDLFEMPYNPKRKHAMNGDRGRDGQASQGPGSMLAASCASATRAEFFRN